ncbi:MAG: T9SS type A sorting domain-containing protein [Flavobacteriales bacterium]
MQRFLIFLTLLFTHYYFAQTTVTGGIYQNTTWTAAGSPYLMTGSMVIFPGVTLTIEPGVELKVTPDYSFNTGNLRYLEVRGTLIAIGTDTAPITFKTTDASIPGQQTWYGIIIKGSQGGNVQLDRFRLHDSFYGISNDIAEAGVNYNWTNCQFKNNNYGVQLNAAMTYNNCLFEGNGVGQAAQIVGGSLTANNCQFINNFCSFTWSNSINIDNCLFQGNGNNIVGSPGIITNCQFIDNDYGLAEAYGHTIDNCYFQGNNVGVDNSGGSNITNTTFEENNIAVKLGDGSTLTNNVISNNNIGVAVLAYSPNTTLIENNTICYNTSYNLQNLTDKNFQVNANCFCSQDSSYIENLILDGYDDITRGLVNYAIYDDSCANVLDYIVKINLDGAADITELQAANWKLKGQDANYIYIESENELQLDLYNMTGQLENTYSFNEGVNRISTADLTKGIYFLKNKEGKSHKVII